MKTRCTDCGDYAIGLVIYHPEENLLRRLELMIGLGFRVYIFDNSPFVDKYSSVIQRNERIVYLTAGKNVGIGYSLSTLCATAYAHGYGRLFFLDQDTGVSTETFEYIGAVMKLLANSVQQQYAALVFNGHTGKEKAVKEVRLAISSGSLFNLSALKQIGWHNESYFVDCVDYELCVRARRHGFKIGSISSTPGFDHVSEQPDRASSIFGKQVFTRRYSAARIKDSLSAYVKLIAGGFFKNRLGDTYALTRSMGIYVVNQLLARVIKRAR
jgi:hypothetical protein